MIEESKQQPTVLVIENDKEMARNISYAFVKSGYQVVSCFDMESALEQIKQKKINIAISDIFMEGMGGIEGITKIRVLQPETRIIAISGGYADMSPNKTLEAAKQMGADAILPKPFELAALKEMAACFL